MQSIFLKEVQMALQGNPIGYIAKVEQQHWQQLMKIVTSMKAHQNTCPILLLSGPSGSGKTITAMMIESILDRMGLETHTLSMDNYFKSMTAEEQQLAEMGKFDLESPERVDIPFLNAQLKDIRDGKPVSLPKYDFRIAKRVPSGQILQRKPQELVILEGIHALNPSVITLSNQEAARCYVNVQTAVRTDSGMLVPPSYIRLLRRMIRDWKYRKRSLTDTIRMHHSVQVGEDTFITPYQHLANYTVNTFLPYEIFAYKEIFSQTPEAMKIAQQIPELAAILQETIPFSLDWIPKNALIREFIGGSVYYNQ
ncbi:MAG: nucleoside kinase [Oscillospiraceae bacterium]|nr:nucleoside kinase [Oscillospiraceae bacterium]